MEVDQTAASSNGDADAKTETKEAAVTRAAAEKEYHLFVSGIGQAASSWHNLRSGPLAQKYRALLCGRDPSEETSWEEFYHMRLLHSLPGTAEFHFKLIELPDEFRNVQWQPSQDGHLALNDNSLCHLLEKSVMLLFEELVKEGDGNYCRSMLPHKNGRLCKTFLKALHGLSKDCVTTLDLKPLNLLQRKAILRLCLDKHCLEKKGCGRGRGGKRTAFSEDAKWAFGVVRGCEAENGQRLREQTEGFGSALKDYLSREFLDVFLGVTDASHSTSNLQDPGRRPSVTTYDLEHPQSGKFCIWAAKNVVSNAFIEKLFEEYKSTLFYDSNAIDMGKEKLRRKTKQRQERYGRAVSFTPEPIAMEVKGKLQPPAPEATECEKHLQAFALQLAEVQNEFIRKQYGGDGHVTLSCNLLHVSMGSVKGSSYSVHSDVSHMTTSKQGSPIWMNDKQTVRLPAETELQTLTWYFSNVDNACEISWVDSNKTKTNPPKIIMKDRETGETRRSLTLGKCGAHWQGPMSQSNVHHQIEPVLDDDRASRVIVSCRFSVNKSQNPTKYQELLKRTFGEIPSEQEQKDMYEHTGVWDRLTVGGAEKQGTVKEASESSTSSEDHTSSGATEQAHKKRKTSQGQANSTAPIAQGEEAPQDWKRIARKDYSLKKTANKDTFPRLGKKEYDSLNIRRAGKVLELKSTMDRVLSLPKVVKAMLKKGQLAWTPRSDSKGNIIKMVPNVFMNREGGQLRLFEIGQTYKASKIAAMVGTNRTTYQRDIYQPGGQEAIIITAPYKNDLLSVLTAQSATDAQFNEPSNPTKVTTPASFGDDEMLYVYGVGGSANKPGATPPDLKTKSKYNYNVTIPDSQTESEGSVNWALCQQAKRKAVVAVFSEHHNFNPGYAGPAADATDLDTVMFLGYYYFHNKDEPQEDEEDVMKSLGKDAPEDIVQWSWFRTRPYCRFHLKRLFTKEEWTELKLEERSHPEHHQIYQHVEVNDELKQAVPLTMQISIEESFKWTEAKIGFKDVLEHCIGGDRLDTFARAEEPGGRLQPPEPSGIGLKEKTGHADVANGEKQNLEKKVGGTKGTIAHCIDSVLLLTQAGFQRFLGYSLTSEKIEDAAAQPLADTALPLVHRMHAYPLGNRAMDTTNVYLRSEWNTKRRERGDPPIEHDRILYDSKSEEHFNDVANLLFQAILVRVTGRVQRFSVYQKFMKEVRKIDVPPLPRMVHFDVDCFSEFVQAELGPNATSISSWVSCQHDGQIPKALRDVDEFVNFLSKLLTKLPFELKQTLLKHDGHGKPNLSRSVAFNTLKKMLTHCVEANEEDFAFIAQAVMLDVEEIYSGVFKEPTSADASTVVGGPGSDAGLSVVRNSGEADSLEDALLKMLSAMNAKPPEYLECFGAKKLEGEDFARWKINNRPLNIYDMEHFLCKIYLTVSQTLGSRCFSEQPYAARPHCWPLKIPKDELEGYETWTVIARESLQSFCKINAAGLFQIPDLCLLRGEKEEREGNIAKCIDIATLTILSGFKWCKVQTRFIPGPNEDTGQTCTDPLLDELDNIHAHPRGICATTNVHGLLHGIVKRYWRDVSLVEGQRIKYKPSSHFKDVVDLAFQVILLAVVGHVNHFEDYHKFVKSTTMTPPCVPRVNDYPSAYKKYLDSLHWIAPYPQQSCHNHLEHTRLFLETPSGLKHFVDGLHKQISATMDAVLPKEDGADFVKSRQVVHTDLQNLLDRCLFPSSSDDTNNLAQQVMLDLEELVQGLFPPPDLHHAAHVICARPADEGLSSISNAFPADWYMSTNQEMPSPQPSAKTLSFMLAVTNEKSNEYLSCMGAVKLPQETFARWKVNGRPLNVYDMENFRQMALMAVLEREFGGGSGCSPTASEFLCPHLPPEDLYWYETVEQALTAYAALSRKGALSIPACCLPLDADLGDREAPTEFITTPV